MIIDVGEVLYLALAKGPIHDPETTSIPGGGHLILAPIEHQSSFFGRENIEEKEKVLKEFKHYMKIIEEIFKRFDMLPVSLETNKHGRNHHVFVQVSSNLLRA